MPSRTRAYYIYLSILVQYHKALWSRRQNSSYYPSRPGSRTSFLLVLIYTFSSNGRLSRVKGVTMMQLSRITRELSQSSMDSCLLCASTRTLLKLSKMAQPLRESSHMIQVRQTRGCKGSATQILLVHKADRLTAEVLHKESTFVSRTVLSLYLTS